jgi:hypothetical protein
MGATPIAGHHDEGGTMPNLRHDEAAVGSRRREMAVWGHIVRPSLMPTIFTPSGRVPAASTFEEMAARKV